MNSGIDDTTVAKAAMNEGQDGGPFAEEGGFGICSVVETTAAYSMSGGRFVVS